MTHALKRLLSKLAALALLAAVALLLYLAVLAPLAGRYLDARERIAEQRQLLGRLSAAASGDGRAIEAEDLAKSGQSAAIYLLGNSDAIRIAELQSLAGKIAEAVGVEIRSIRALPPREQDGIRLLGAEAQMSATIEQLQKILHKLESSRPYVLVDTLQITPPPVVSDDNPGATAVLEVRLGLLGAAAAKKR